MKWAFWRRASAAPAAAARGGEDSDPGQADPARVLRVRARRRLIGAAALLLAAVIVLPMVLDPAPRPVPEHVAIDLPAEKTPFNPRLPLAAPDPVPEAGAGEGKARPGPDQAGADAPAADGRDPVGPQAATATKGERAPQAAAKDERVGGAGATAAKADGRDAAPAADRGREEAQAADAQRARELLAGKSATEQRAAAGRFFVQAAALRNEQAARELAARLKKAGLPSFTERVQASDGARWRVRVGPYDSRQEAESARARLRELGTGADLIAP